MVCVDIAQKTNVERNRLRADYGKLPSSLEIPQLLDMQKNSYKEFLQVGISKKKRKNKGLEAAFNAIFPIEGHSGDAVLEYVDYRFGKPIFSVNECLINGASYAAPMRVKIRFILHDDDKAIKDIKEQEVYMGEMPLMTDRGTFVINGTERVVVSQLHRSPGVFFEHDKGKGHSSGKPQHSARVIPYRGSWLDFEFDHKDILFVRIDRRRKLPASILLRALGFNTESILEEFFECNILHLQADDILLDIVETRLLGEVFPVDIKDKSGKVIVAAGRRIAAKHIKLIAKEKIKQIAVPYEYLVGRTLALDLINKETGEIIAAANAEISEDALAILQKCQGNAIKVLYTNELDHGSYISETMRLDTTNSKLEALVEIYRVMRPGEPPTKDSAEQLFKNLFFSDERYDLSQVGRMKFNLRLGRKEAEGSPILSADDIVAVIKELINIRDGRGDVDDIDHLG
ncbi:MAG: hypothetical protein COC15_03365, partial [Legionellales bacterium]